MKLRQLEGEAHVPVGGALALLDGGDEDVPPRGHVASPLVSPEQVHEDQGDIYKGGRKADNAQIKL